MKDELHAAENEYLLDAPHEAGLGEMPDVWVILNALGIFTSKIIDSVTALAIFAASKDAVPMDGVIFVLARARLCMKQGDWRDIERTYVSA